ncbi:MAG: phosphatase PAP2 family protein [Bacteroidota bacterium]
MFSYLESVDRYLLLCINQTHHAAWDAFFCGITHEVWGCLFYAWPLYSMAKKLDRKSFWLGIVALLGLLLLTDQVTSGLVKPGVRRLRPCCDPSLQQWVHVVGTYRGSYGFFSAHAANGFGVATFLFLVLRVYSPSGYLPLGWAALVSYGRVYGGVHYPLDVVCGALSGLVSGWLIYRGYDRWVLHKS